MNNQNRYYRNNTNDNRKSENDSTTITEQDKFALGLLDTLLIANIISFASGIFAYLATINGIKSINKKYNNSKEQIHNADELALISVYLGFIARLIITKVGFDKFEYFYRNYINGDTTINIQTNIDINTANTLGILAGLYAIKFSQDIYQRGLLNINV